MSNSSPAVAAPLNPARDCPRCGQNHYDMTRPRVPTRPFKPQRTGPSDMPTADAEIRRLRTALLSIARNTCCDRCQEAAKVAQAALEGR